MKLYIFFVWSSIANFFCISAMHMPPPLAHINEVSFYLSYILKQDFENFAQSSPDQEILQAKKTLCNAMIHTLTHVRRLTYLQADPITLHGAIKGIVSIPLVYTAEPPVLYWSDKAQFQKLPNGKLKVIENTQYFADHMLEVLRPYCPIYRSNGSN